MKLADRKAEIEALPNYVSGSLSDTTDPQNADIHILEYTLNKIIKKWVDGSIVEETDGTLTLKERWLVHDSGLETEWIERVA